MADGLTPKQARFVAEYLVDCNATQAAIRAGYSEQTAESQGSRLLKNVKVAEAVKARQAKHIEAADITAERVLRELGEMAMAKVEVNMQGKVAALNALAKHLGLLTEKVEHSGSVSFKWQGE